jgi:hypothetical protein
MLALFGTAMKVSMAQADQLTIALKEARIAQASYLDALLDLRDAKSLRLDALRAAVAPTLADHPDARELFNLNLQDGQSPKLWVDLISSVVMEPDPRTYRLVQDRDSQRETLFESPDVNQMTAYLTRYLAHRLIAHEKLANAVAPVPPGLVNRISLMGLVFIWASGVAFGVLGLLGLAMLLGKLHF